MSTVRPLFETKDKLQLSYYRQFNAKLDEMGLVMAEIDRRTKDIAKLIKETNELMNKLRWWRPFFFQERLDRVRKLVLVIHYLKDAREDYDLNYNHLVREYNQLVSSHNREFPAHNPVKPLPILP